MEKIRILNCKNRTTKILLGDRELESVIRVNAERRVENQMLTEVTITLLTNDFEWESDTLKMAQPTTEELQKLQCGGIVPHTIARQ